MAACLIPSLSEGRGGLAGGDFGARTAVMSSDCTWVMRSSSTSGGIAPAWL
jgi:hypothetical protein